MTEASKGREGFVAAYAGAVEEGLKRDEIADGVRRTQLDLDELRAGALAEEAAAFDVTAPEWKAVQELEERMRERNVLPSQATYRLPSMSTSRFVLAVAGLAVALAVLVAGGFVQYRLWTTSRLQVVGWVTDLASDLTAAQWLKGHDTFVLWALSILVSLVAGHLAVPALLVAEMQLHNSIVFHVEERIPVILSYAFASAYVVAVANYHGRATSAFGTPRTLVVEVVLALLALIALGASSAWYADGYPDGAQAFLGVAALIALTVNLGVVLLLAVVGTLRLPPLVLWVATPVLIVLVRESARATGSIRKKIGDYRNNQVPELLPGPSSAPRRPPSYLPPAERAALRQSLTEARSEWTRVTLERVVLPFLRRRINEILTPAFTLRLTVRAAPGLERMRAQDFVVRTAAFEVFEARLEKLRGGAIGVAGPRGAGKSTLLETYARGTFLGAGSRRRVTLVESVPVKYDAREFMLHLYARVCEEVINFSRELPEVQGALRNRLQRQGYALLKRLRPGYLLAAAAAVAAGVVAATVFRAATLVSGLVAVVACLLLVKLLPARIPVSGTDDSRKPRDVLELADTARARLLRIRFQQRFTSGWSGKVAVPFAGELTKSASHDLLQQVQSYPELVHEFRAFLEATLVTLSAVPDVDDVRLLVVIDELDKMPSADQARQFIDEIKGLFSLEGQGYLYLVSVSEDALASFEKQGTPIRDAFDSAFDAICRVEYLTVQDTASLLSSRVIGLPGAYIALCHCLSGGLPREIVRVARSVLSAGGRLQQDHRDPADSPSLGEVASMVVHAELTERLAGLGTVVSRCEAPEPHRSTLMRHLRASAEGNLSAQKLLEAVEAWTLPGPVAEEPPEWWNDLVTLGTGGVAQLYFSATLLQVFDDSLDKRRLGRGMRLNETGSFDVLASVRQLLSVNSRLAWVTVSAFRQAWGMRTLDPPELTRVTVDVTATDSQRSPAAAP